MKDIACTQSFRDFSRYNYIYVDKTRQIFRLLRNRRVFISRPRRFGKSLMLDTIATLFSEGADPYFRGTWVHDRWTDRKYPVLRLNFLDYLGDFDEFRKLLFRDIAAFAGKLGLREAVAGDSEPHEALRDLLKALDERGVSIVILIDEYDALLTKNMNAPVLYERFRAAIRALFGAVRGRRCVRFLCVTGVTRLREDSIFPGGSGIKDLSYYGPVSAITGFDRDEIRKCYADYINLAVSLEKGIPESAVSEEQREELLRRLAGEYDGYSFDAEYRHRVFSTWSVNTFFHEAASRKKVIFSDYWYDNGGIPSILAKYLETHIISLLEYSGDIEISMDDFWNPASLPDMRQEVLMCQTGYLTARSRIPNGNSVRLGVPDGEVRRSLEKALSLLVFPSADFAADENEQFFSGASAGEIAERLSSLMCAISHEIFHKMNERTVHGLIHAFMIGAGQPERTVAQGASGRSDIVLDYRNRRLVLGLRYAETEKECPERLCEAAEQIRERRYGDLLPAKTEVLQIALVFNGGEGVRQFTHYETVV